MTTQTGNADYAYQHNIQCAECGHVPGDIPDCECCDFAAMRATGPVTTWRHKYADADASCEYPEHCPRVHGTSASGWDDRPHCASCGGTMVATHPYSPSTTPSIDGFGCLWRDRYPDGTYRLVPCRRPERDPIHTAD